MLPDRFQFFFFFYGTVEHSMGFQYALYYYKFIVVSSDSTKV